MRDPAYLTVPWFDVPKMSTTFPLQLPGNKCILRSPTRAQAPVRLIESFRIHLLRRSRSLRRLQSHSHEQARQYRHQQ